MTEVFDDIETLRNALIAFDEGASDERYAATHQLRIMLERKIAEVENFETELEEMFDSVPV
mgnify:CR=1 FL=1